jgi:hypothetical protein
MIRQAVMTKFKSYKFGKSLAKGELVYVKTENDHYSCARHPEDTLWFGLTEKDFVFLVSVETAKAFTQQLDELRSSIINKMKTILASKAERSITFNEGIIFNVIDQQGENECIVGFIPEDGVMILSYFGDDKEADLFEATTEQLIHMLQLIEAGKYDVEELDDDRHSFFDKTDDEN